MNNLMKILGKGVAGLALALLPSTGHAQAEDILFQPVQPYDQTPITQLIQGLLGIGNSRIVLYITIAPGATLTPGGLALDEAGNMYMSDYGLNSGGGNIVMMPKDGRLPITIFEDLDRPSDIEVSPDGRSLIIAGPDGRVARRYFGVSVRVNFAGFSPKETTVSLKTDSGTATVSMSSDGYFHFSNVLQPEQLTTVVDLVIRNGSDTYTRFQQPLQAVNGKLLGETILDVTLP